MGKKLILGTILVCIVLAVLFATSAPSNSKCSFIPVGKVNVPICEANK